MTTAKVFAYCVGAEILGLDTLDVIAAAAPAEISRVSVAVDAQRGQVVAATFARGKDGSFLPVEPSQRVNVSRWLSNVQSGVFFSGPVLRKLSGRVPEGVLLLREEHWSPTAVALGRLAARQYAAGRRDDVWSLVPRYSRKSAAEEKWEAKSTGPDTVSLTPFPSGPYVPPQSWRRCLRRCGPAETNTTSNWLLGMYTFRSIRPQKYRAYRFVYHFGRRCPNRWGRGRERKKNVINERNWPTIVGIPAERPADSRPAASRSESCWSRG